MKKNRFSDEQTVRILREADSAPIAEVAKHYGVSDASIYAWRKRFGEMISDDVKRLKTLELENNRLKKLVAERDLEGAPRAGPLCHFALVKPAACMCADSGQPRQSRLREQDAGQEHSGG
jgi:putative transposase